MATHAIAVGDLGGGLERALSATEAGPSAPPRMAHIPRTSHYPLGVTNVFSCIDDGTFRFRCIFA
jgi:hypothetical protein